MIGAVGVLGAERSRPVLERFGMKSIRKAASAAWHNRERKPGNAPPRWLLAGHDGRRGRQLRNSPSPVEMCNKSVNPATCTVPSGTPSAVGVGAAPTRVLGMRSRVAGVGTAGVVSDGNPCRRRRLRRPRSRLRRLRRHHLRRPSPRAAAARVFLTVFKSTPWPWTCRCQE